MIKQADIPMLNEVAKLGEEFFNEAKLPGKFSIDAFVTSWSSLLLSGVSEVYVYEEEGAIIGAIGILFTPSPFTGLGMAIEAFWYVSKKSRSMAGPRLLAKAIDRAAERNCDMLTMSAVTGSPTYDAVVRYYNRLGFTEIERHFLLQL